MEDPKENLKTLKKLGKLEHTAIIRSPRHHLKALAKRLIYLHKKKKFKSEVPGPNFYDDEIIAMYWLLAEYQEASGYDVAEVLRQTKDSDRINFHKYDAILEEVNRKKARKSAEQEGLDQSDASEKEG